MTTEVEAPTDYSSPSEPVKPDFGTGATFSYGGDRGLDPTRIAKLFADIFTTASTYRKRYEPEIIKAYSQYFGDAEDRGKTAWQSQVHVPLAKQAVDTTAAKITDALFQTEDWFDILPYIKSDDKKVDRAKKLLKWQWQKSKARSPIAQAIKNALICGVGPLKVQFSRDSREQTGVIYRPRLMEFQGQQVALPGKYEFQREVKVVKKLKLEPILPLNIWLDPTGRNRFVIHRVKRSISDLWALTKDQYDAAGNLIQPKVYDAEWVEKIQPGMRDTEADLLEAVIRRDTPHVMTDQDVDLFEFWGDFPDPSNGVILYHNVLATFAGRQYCIRMPEANPFHHGLPPFVMFKSSNLPGQVYPYGILQPGMRIQDAVDRHVNVVLDKGMLQVPTVEVLPMAARNPQELTPDNIKFAPGKTWARKSHERAIFYPVEGFKPPDGTDLAIIDRLVSFYQMSNNVTEFATGQTLTGHRKTKEEVLQRVSATDQIFNDAAVYIESEALSPLLEMMYSLMVQFEDQYDDDSLLRMFGDAPEDQMAVTGLKSMSPEERWRAMKLDAEFRVTGITNKITAQDRLNRLMNFLKVMQSDPTLSVLVDKFEELRYLMQNLDLPKNMILNETEAVLQALQQAQLAMIMGMSRGQGGQGMGAETEGGNPHNQMTAAGAEGRAAAAAETAPQ